MNCFKLSVFILALLFVTSCGDDDSDEITGQWILSSVAITDCPDDIPETTLTAENGCVVFFGEGLCIEFSFESDGIIVVSTSFDNNDPEVYSGTYTGDNGDIEICFDGECENAFIENGNFILKGTEDTCEVRYLFVKN